MSVNNKTLIIGLGNPILGDDGVGWRVVEEVQKQLTDKNSKLAPKVEFKFLSLGGLSLMEHMAGFRDVIVVDSIMTGQNPNGTVYSLPLSSLPNFSSGHSTAIHDTSLQTALDVGRQMGMTLPDDVWVVGVEAEYVYDFSEELSPPVSAAVPSAVELVIEVLDKNRMKKTKQTD